MEAANKLMALIASWSCLAIPRVYQRPDMPLCFRLDELNDLVDGGFADAGKLLDCSSMCVKYLHPSGEPRRVRPSASPMNSLVMFRGAPSLYRVFHAGVSPATLCIQMRNGTQCYIGSMLPIIVH
jgi:hypothetical protein